jgi:hypothetical protein
LWATQDVRRLDIEQRTQLQSWGIQGHIVSVDRDRTGRVRVEVVQSDSANEERRCGRARRNDLEIGRECGEIGNIAGTDRLQSLFVECGY